MINTSSKSTSWYGKIHSTGAANSPEEGKLRSIIQNLFVVSPEDLILSKSGLGERFAIEVQLNDVRNLLKSVKGLNRSYLPLGKGIGHRIPLSRGE